MFCVGDQVILTTKSGETHGTVQKVGSTCLYCYDKNGNAFHSHIENFRFDERYTVGSLVFHGPPSKENTMEKPKRKTPVFDIGDKAVNGIFVAEILGINISKDHIKYTVKGELLGTLATWDEENMHPYVDEYIKGWNESIDTVLDVIQPYMPLHFHSIENARARFLDGVDRVKALKK